MEPYSSKKRLILYGSFWCRILFWRSCSPPVTESFICFRLQVLQGQASMNELRVSGLALRGKGYRVSGLGAGSETLNPEP